MNSNLKRKLKLFWQRITRGWDDSDTWALDATIALFALPRLKRFRQLTIGYPVGLTEGEWKRILNEIEWFLEKSSDGAIQLKDQEERERYKKAKLLWGEYFNSLWW